MATDSGIHGRAPDAIHANCEVALNACELDAVSGGMLWLPLLAYKVAAPSKSGGSGGGQSDPLAQMFQQIMQQVTQGG